MQHARELVVHMAGMKLVPFPTTIGQQLVKHEGLRAHEYHLTPARGVAV
jgi:hypothetical protein